MTPAEAAEIIGCSPQQVRTLCRQGKIKFGLIYPFGKSKKPLYNIPKREAERIAKIEHTVGWKRGRKRN